jgi:hypothetical protein
MCNEVARRTSLDLRRNDFDQRKLHLFTPQTRTEYGAATLDKDHRFPVIVRARRFRRRGAGGPGIGDHGTRDWRKRRVHGGRACHPALEQARRAWQAGAWFRVRGRDLRSGRRLIPADAFDGFTVPTTEPGPCPPEPSASRRYAEAQHRSLALRRPPILCPLRAIACNFLSSPVSLPAQSRPDSATPRPVSGPVPVAYVRKPV